MSIRQFTKTMSFVLVASCVITACQTPIKANDSQVKVALPNGKVRIIESTVPKFSATVMRVNVQHHQQSFNIDSRLPTVTSQGLVTGGLFTPTAPEGAHWQLLLLGETPVEMRSKRPAYLRMSGGQMQGLTGCNVMSGAYNRQNEKMQFIQVSGTNTICPEIQQTEKRLIFALQQLRTWRLTDNNHHLQFLSEKGEVLAEFVALSP